MSDEDNTRHPDDVETDEQSESNRKWWILGAIALLLVAVIVALVVTDPWSNNDSTPSTTSSETSPSSNTQTPPSSPPVVEQEATIEGPDGLQDIAILSGGAPVLGDSTNLPETPAVISDELRDKCGVLDNWKKLYDCVEYNHLWWYRDAVNKFSRELGFNWDDVKHWAEVGPKRAQFILVANLPGKTDEQARNDVRSLVKDDDAVNKMPIVRRDCIVNTRGLKEHELHPFVDCKQQVRVSLAPLVIRDNKVGWDPKGLRSGVFVDCYNLWWITKIVSRPPPPPTVPPGTKTTVSTPPRTTTTKPPVTTTTAPPTTTTTTTTTTTPPTTTTTTTPETTSKTPTSNPSVPNGIDPLPTYGPEETSPPPPPSNPAPPPAELPTDAPPASTIVVPSATAVPDYSPPPPAPELNPTTTEAAPIEDPDA